MLEGLVVVLIIVLLAGFAGLFWLVNRKLNAPKDDTALGLIKQDLQILGDILSKTQSSMTERMDRTQEQMRQSVMSQFSESAKLISEVTTRLTKLDETNKRVVDVADELKTLQNVLQNPKQRGVLGEYYLQTVLENVLSPGGFELQYHLGKDAKTGKELICDAVVKLDRGKLLPIDSKFSLENYNRLVEETDKVRRETLVKSFKQDLKDRIDETAKYILPELGTMDFAFMFIPSEAVYYDLLINKVGTTQTSARDLIEYAFRDKRVIIVSPTSFMAYLQTVVHGLRSLQIEEQAKEIRLRVGQLGQHLASYDQFMQKLGNSLGTTVNHYNNAHKELKKVDKDVVKIAGSSPVIEPLLVDKPQVDE